MEEFLPFDPPTYSKMKVSIDHRSSGMVLSNMKRMDARKTSRKSGICSMKGHSGMNFMLLLHNHLRAPRPTTGSFPARMAALPAMVPGKAHEQDADRSEVLGELHRILRAIAHDLRTPLATIMNCVELMGEKVGNDGHQVVEQMRRSADRMSELIAGMLERAREGAELPETRWIDMPRLLDRVRNEVEQSQPRGTGSGKIKLSNAPWIHGDPMKVAQVFTNLLSNAVKYSSQVLRPLIHVEGEVKGKEIVYSINDNGIGIGPDDLNVLFTPFKRSKNALGFEGYGVGLSIVKEIMQSMKGRVWVTSTLGSGTTFQLAFPIPAEDGHGD